MLSRWMAAGRYLMISVLRPFRRALYLSWWNVFIRKPHDPTDDPAVEAWMTFPFWWKSNIGIRLCRVLGHDWKGTFLWNGSGEPEFIPQEWPKSCERCWGTRFADTREGKQEGE